LRDFGSCSIFDFLDSIGSVADKTSSYSITSSARTKIERGTVRPSALAVFSLNLARAPRRPAEVQGLGDSAAAATVRQPQARRRD
jgi:hypothetical protein